jgi:hypothetical protein
MIKATYSLIKVQDVKKNVYILENGGLRGVLAVSGINFSLLSEQEQEVLIGQFKSFLDGLDFPVEILIVSRLENINNYLKILHLRLEEEKSPLIKFQLEDYISFLEDYLENHKIMKKLFYVVVPYDTLEIGVGFLKKKGAVEEESFQVKLEQLETRIHYVYESLSNLGLSVKRLYDQELIELLFELYNPNLKWSQVPKQLIEKLTQLI